MQKSQKVVVVLVVVGWWGEVEEGESENKIHPK